MTLTPEQQASFRDLGVVVVPDLLAEPDLAPLERELSQWIDRRANELHAQRHIADLHEDEPFDTRYARLFEQSSWIGAGLDIAYLRGAALFDLICGEPVSWRDHHPVRTDARRRAHHARVPTRRRDLSG